MDKKLILNKLEELSVKSRNDFKSTDEIEIWANKVEPLIDEVDDLYSIHFKAARQDRNYNSETRIYEPNLSWMLKQYELAVNKLKLQQEANKKKDMIYFSPGSQLDIQIFVSENLINAQNTLWIVDSWMDEKIIEEISNVSAKEIRLLTKNTKGKFKLRLEAAKAQFDKKTELNVMLSDSFHDRYYILDRKEVWTTGASYNKAGKKGTSICKISDETEKEKIISDFIKFWGLAREYKPES